MEHFEQVLAQELLHILRILVSLILIPYHTIKKKCGFEVLSANNTQNANKSKNNANANNVKKECK